MADGPAPLNWPRWGFPVVVALATVGLGLFAIFSLPHLLGDQQWLTMGDAKWTVESAQRVSWGAIGTVYSINDQYLPLPGFLILLAPAVTLGNHLGYVNSYPYALDYPTMWIVVAPVFMVTGSLSILGADYLADTLGVRSSRRRLLAVAIALVVVLPTCLWAGHPEDLLALALSCVSVALLLRHRPIGAAIALTSAVMMQPWAVLLIPTVVVASPAGRRLRVLFYASALPAITALSLMAADFHDAYRSLVLQPMQGIGQRLPWWSVAHRMTIVENGAHDVVRIGSTPRLFAVILAVLVPVALRHDIRPPTVMLAASVALVGRGAFETQFWCWYLAPAAVFLALSVAAAAPDKLRWSLGALSTLVFYSFAAGGYDSYSLPPMVGLGLLVATAAGAIVAANIGLRPQWAGVDLATARRRWQALVRSTGGAEPGALGDGGPGQVSTDPAFSARTSATSTTASSAHLE